MALTTDKVSAQGEVSDPPRMPRPALACSAVRAGIIYRRDDTAYEGSVNLLGTGLSVAYNGSGPTTNNWHLLAHIRGNQWYIKYAPQAMLSYYKIDSRLVDDRRLCQIINHFFRENPNAN